MGKMRFKLSHVMPHVWFYKLKEIGKTGDRTSHSHCISSPHKQLASTPPSAAKSGSLARIYTSPVNHKAMDISFPETPKKSPLNHAEKEDDEAGVDLHDSVDFANFGLGFSSSNTLQAFSSVEGPEMEEFENDDHLPGDTSAARYSGVSFDVRELERRLKALGQEERRKYYNSPMFSVALPSPILDGVSSEILDLPDSRFAQILRENEGGIRKSLHEDQTKFFHEGGRSSIASTSFRQSTSSSDTGFERASSSVWEKDVFSLTSEGSDPFTTIDHDVDASLLHRFSRQIKKQKDKKRHLSRWVKAAENPLLQGNSIVFNRQSDNTDVMCTVETTKTSSPSIPEPQPGIPVDSINFWHTQAEQPLQNLLDFEECDLSLLQYDSDDHRSSRHRRGLSQEFSYSQTKDRLLSGRFSLDQCSDSALSESELENATKNYTRFKLQKRSSSSRSNPSPSPDPGLYKVSCKKSIEPEVLAMLKGHDNNSNYSRTSSRRSSTDNRSSNSYRKQFIEPESSSIQKGHEDCCSLSRSSSRRSSTDSRYSYQNMGSNIVAERNNIEGHSWYKGTLRVVKENTREPSFQAFSSKAQSKVLDSFAMVKCSYDPHQDFKESMVEMILEKELQSSNELVELLQCYLTLNSEKYHDTIIKVFGEVWSDLFHRV